MPQHEPPCMECLKYSICLSKGKVSCMDLVDWLVSANTNEDMGCRIARFERDYWNKDIGVFSTQQPEIGFKKERDNYQCLIVK